MSNHLISGSTKFGQMDLAGIEPASESLSLEVSSITVINLGFPPLTA